MMFKKHSSLLLCLWTLVLLCGAARAGDLGDTVRGLVKGVVDAVKNSSTRIENTAETVLSYDFNNDGQIGEFKSQENDTDTRAVGADPNAASRFKVFRQRSGASRTLTSEEQEAEKK